MILTRSWLGRLSRQSNKSYRRVVHLGRRSRNSKGTFRLDLSETADRSAVDGAYAVTCARREEGEATLAAMTVHCVAFGDTALLR